MNKFMKTSVIIACLATGALLISCNGTSNKSPDMEKNEHDSTAAAYACPMHPEVKGKAGDKCSKCGMDLEPVKEDSRGLRVELRSTPQNVQAGEVAKLELAFKSDTGDVGLELSHEKKVHLMLISDDLTSFSHIHPTEQSDGSYAVTHVFPHGGKYLVYTDFKPLGAAQIVDRKEIEVKGKAGQKENFTEKFVSEVGAYKVTLKNGNDFRTGRTQSLEVSIEKEGKVLSEKDIQQYLGANAHIVMISKEDKDFLHIHPVSDSRFPVYASTKIRKSGIYRIWVEFQVEGQVHVADFTVDVQEGEGAKKEEHHHSGHH